MFSHDTFKKQYEEILHKKTDIFVKFFLFLMQVELCDFFMVNGIERLIL